MRRGVLTAAQLEGLIGEVMTMETMVASLAMLTLGNTVGKGDLMSDEQRTALSREVLMWAAEAIDRIDRAKQLSARLESN